jgi:hypothetical protein
MEDKVLKLEQELESLEKSNPSLYIKEIKQIKKNAIKLEIDINKLLSDENDSNSNESEDFNDLESDFDIDNEINLYSKLVKTLNDDNMNNKSIEELSNILIQIEKIEKNIINYQTLKVELDIKTI